MKTLDPYLCHCEYAYLSVAISSLPLNLKMRNGLKIQLQLASYADYQYLGNARTLVLQIWPQKKVDSWRHTCASHMLQCKAFGCVLHGLLIDLYWWWRSKTRTKTVQRPFQVHAALFSKVTLLIHCYLPSCFRALPVCISNAPVTSVICKTGDFCISKAKKHLLSHFSLFFNGD